MSNNSKPTVFLSVDLDYWGVSRSSCEYMTERSYAKEAIPFFIKLIEKADRDINPLPLYIVESHEEMLPIVNENRAEELWNVDFHSDFSAWVTKEDERKSKRLKPSDGNWVNYVKWARYGKYVWIPPDDFCYYKGTGPGVCDPEFDPFSQDMGLQEVGGKQIPFVNLIETKPFTNWKKTMVRDGGATRRTLVNPPRLPRIIPWSRVTTAAIAISPKWLQIENMKEILDMLGVYHQTLKARDHGLTTSRTSGTIKPMRRKS